jgi:hypothetical protein
MKSGNLNFLEPSGPLQACNRNAFYSPELCLVTISKMFNRQIILESRRTKELYLTDACLKTKLPLGTVCLFTHATTKYKHGNSGGPSGDSGCVGQCFVQWPSPAIPITVSVWGQQMSTLTIANSCISQQEKERGVLPNVTRKRGAVKNTVCDLSFISDTSGSRRYIPFFNAEFRFRPLPVFVFWYNVTNKRRRFENISRKFCYGFLCFSHLFLLPCEPQQLRLVANYKTKDRGSLPGRGRHFFLWCCVQTVPSTHPVSHPTLTKLNIAFHRMLISFSAFPPHAPW